MEAPAEEERADHLKWYSRFQEWLSADGQCDDEVYGGGFSAHLVHLVVSLHAFLMAFMMIFWGQPFWELEDACDTYLCQTMQPQQYLVIQVIMQATFYMLLQLDGCDGCQFSGFMPPKVGYARP